MQCTLMLPLLRKNLAGKQLEDWRKCVSSDCDSELVLQDLSYFFSIFVIILPTSFKIKKIASSGLMCFDW